MKQMSQEEAKRICDRVMSLSRADECRVSIQGTRAGNIRTAKQRFHCGFESRYANVDQRRFRQTSGERPPSTSLMIRPWSVRCAVPKISLVWHQKIQSSCPPSASKNSRLRIPISKKPPRLIPQYRAEVAAQSINLAKKNKLVTAGFFLDTMGFEVIANSNGVFGYQESTNLSFSVTARTEDGRGSGWVTRSANDVRLFDPREASLKSRSKKHCVRLTRRLWSQGVTLLSWNLPHRLTF